MTFDRLTYVDRLKEAGVEEPVARAHAEALRHALDESVATKQDLRELGDRMEGRIAEADRKADHSFATLDRKIEDGLARLDRKIDDGLAALDRKIDDRFGILDRKIDEGLATLDRKFADRFATLDGKIDITGRDLIIKGASGLIILATLMIGLKLLG